MSSVVPHIYGEVTSVKIYTPRRRKLPVLRAVINRKTSLYLPPAAFLHKPEKGDRILIDFNPVSLQGGTFKVTHWRDDRVEGQFWITQENLQEP